MVNEGNSLANSLVYTHAQHNNVYEKKNLRGGRGGGGFYKILKPWD